MEKINKKTKQTCLLTGEAPPTANNMVPVSARVLNDRLISVPTASDTPASSTYPGLEKLTVYRFCETGKKESHNTVSHFRNFS